MFSPKGCLNDGNLCFLNSVFVAAAFSSLSFQPFHTLTADVLFSTNFRVLLQQYWCGQREHHLHLQQLRAELEFDRCQHDAAECFDKLLDKSSTLRG